MRRMSESRTPNNTPRVAVDHLDYRAMFGFVRLFDSMRMALHPAKLLTALMLVVLLYFGGMAMDLVWGEPVDQATVDRMIVDYLAPMESPRPTFDDARFELAYRSGGRVGVFRSLIHIQIEGFDHLVVSAIRLNFGIEPLLHGEGLRSGGVVGAVGLMTVGTWSWLSADYPLFLSLYLLYAFLLTALLGGAITRIAAVEACTGHRIAAFDALRFTVRHYHWIVLSVLLPVLLVFGLGLVMAIAGMVLFSVPVLNVLGAVLFPLFLLVGLAVALLLIALALSVPVMMPTVVIEQADAFDTVSRAFNYSVGQLWRTLFYNAVMVVFGAVTYLLVGLVLFLTLYVTHVLVGWWSLGATSFEVLLPPPKLGRLIADPVWDRLGFSGKTAAAILLVWVKLLVFFLPAYAFSYYLSAQTWIYLLLRRAADGVWFDQIEQDPTATDPQVQARVAPSKVEDVQTHEDADANDVE